jgi:hypothetical protein
MPLPVWAAMANGGKLYQLDDSSVGADKYVSGSDYTAFTASLIMSPFTAGPGTYSSMRKMVLDVETGAALSLTAQGFRDGAVSGALVTRTISLGEAPAQIVPLKVMMPVRRARSAW